jgi:Protein of unknown function (DUF2796)
MSMRVAAVLLAVAAYPAAAQAPHRELGPHVHGRGTLNIAVEGDKVSMELETPGMDIVGFEHAAKSKRDLSAVEKAKAQLSAPLSLFALPASAGCRLSASSVTIEHGEHDHSGKEEATATKENGSASAKEEGHSEFHAEYTFECASVNNITAIEFGYFRAFAGAEKLDINLITPKGQSKFEASRAKPTISLAGMM